MFIEDNSTVQHSTPMGSNNLFHIRFYKYMTSLRSLKSGLNMRHLIHYE